MHLPPPTPKGDCGGREEGRAGRLRNWARNKKKKCSNSTAREWKKKVNKKNCMYIHGEGSIECMKFNIDWIFRHCAGAARGAVERGRHTVRGNFWGGSGGGGNSELPRATAVQRQLRRRLRDDAPHKGYTWIGGEAIKKTAICKTKTWD